MNKEAIVERVARIHADMETCKSTYVKLEGHLAEAEHWIKEIYAKEKEQEAQEQTPELECGQCGHTSPSMAVMD